MRNTLFSTEARVNVECCLSCFVLFVHVFSILSISSSLKQSLMITLSSHNQHSVFTLSEMSSTSCAKSAWKQELNSCAADYRRGWTKTHFLSLVLHKSRHFAMWPGHQRQIPSHESGAFQFSLTFQRRVFFALVCAGRWHLILNLKFTHREKRSWSGIHTIQ